MVIKLGRILQLCCGYSDTLDMVNLSVIHNQMIETNGLWDFKTADNTFCLAKADELKE